MNNETHQIKGFTLAIIIIIAIVSSTIILFPTLTEAHTYEAKSFSSYDEIIDFLKDNHENFSNDYFYYESPRMGASAMDDTKSFNVEESSSNSIDYSETNIQVEGVDEPDIVKTDGKYLYIIANSKIYIIESYPAEHADIISEISFKDNIYINEIFINKDRLIVFGNLNRDIYDNEKIASYWWGGISTTIINIYDISDRENPNLIKEIESDGWYFDSRMIDDYVYIITTEYTYEIYNVLDGNETINIPQIKINNITKKVSADQIYYMDIPERLDIMTNILSIDINDEKVSQKSFLVASSQNMYVSKENIYLAYTQYPYTPWFDVDNSNNNEKTIIHRISINQGDINYESQGEVPGRVLNQFSMDEYNDFFRIATTTGQVWNSEIQSSNNIYILDEDLIIVSEIEDIAPGEQIYSARFIGKKAYLVTFKKIDPFFTIDLSDPYNPKILGKLKIPGYSDYLHPYDENHIIGIGKDTVEPQEENQWRDFDFAWYQGLKIALFDVSDFDNPKELAKIIIGDRGTDSPALSEHKAFLFDRVKELLVIPVNLYEIDDEIKEQYNNYTGDIYGEFTFQGAYVYKLSIDKGFEFKGRITHMSDDEKIKIGYYPHYDSSISRSLYIENVLYTISNQMVKMNDLYDLNEINSIKLI